MKTLMLPALALMLGGLQGCGDEAAVFAQHQDTRQGDELPGADALRGAEVNNQLAVDLLIQLTSQKCEPDAKCGGGKALVAPASVSTALAMLATGAGGETADEMQQTLHFAKGAEGRAEMNRTMAAFSRTLTAASSDDATVLIANREWARLGLKIQDTYAETLKSSYDAGIEPLDFAGNADAARVAINGWIAEHTNGRIKEMLKPGAVVPQTALVATNAFFFKADWKLPFDSEQSFDGSFNLPGGEKQDARYMTQTATFYYEEVPGVQMLEMPYKGDRFVLDVVLPREVTSSIIGPIQREKTAALAFDELKPAKVKVTLPLFAAGATHHLVPALRQLGMSLPFAGEADFSGITGEGGLSLGDVVHAPFLTLTEKGTEAGASTATIIYGTGTQEPAEFTADRPFLYVLRDRETGAWLLAGIHEGE